MKPQKIIIGLVFLAVLFSAGCDRGLPKAVVETSFGVFEITLYSKDAPSTVKNFVDLTKMGFYDNIAFFQITKDKILLTGDPSGRGDGGPGYVIAPEYSDRTNVKGAVGMWHGYDVNSAGSQFYICSEPTHDFDGKTSVFGKVTSGFSVIKKISRIKVDKNGVPLQPVYIKKITIKQ